MLPIAINNTQDTSLQNFANIYLGKNHLGMELGDELDPNVVSYAAAVSIILGSKLHESNGELTLVSFIIIIFIYFIAHYILLHSNCNGGILLF